MMDKVTPPASLPDDALVVRGGLNRAEDLADKVGTHPAGITGWSVESAADLTLEQLAAPIRHNQIGVSTVGAVRQSGGDVIPTSGRSPNHATMTGVTAEQASKLLTPTIKNPAKSS